MPNGSVGVFNGLLSLACVCYSVTVEKSMFLVFFPNVLSMHRGHVVCFSEKRQNI